MIYYLELFFWVLAFTFVLLLLIATIIYALQELIKDTK
jgi:hypothetical protein